MVERLPKQNEVANDTTDQQELARREQVERLRENVEKNAESAPEANQESARENVEKVLNQHEDEKKNTDAKELDKPKQAPRVRNKKALDASFTLEMKEARRHMSKPSQTFSKLIHNKTIEKTSEAVGSTIARPNAILYGSLFALIFTAGLYFWARYVGYPLSGFETIGAFFIGWLVGIIIDFVRITITGKQ